MKRTILLSLSLLAFTLIPGMAAAAETAPAAPCNDLSFLDAAPLTPAATALAFASLSGAMQAQSGGCCVGKQQQCENRCQCGVFEFNCDPASCQSSCICNICP